MKKLKLTECKICGETKTTRGFSFHISQKHKMNIEDYIVKYELGGDHPLCVCGCGEKVTIRGYDVMDYKVFHCPDGKYKKGEPIIRNENWKKNVAEGIRRWNKEQMEINPNYRKGKNSNSYNKKVSESTKEKLRNAVKKQIKEGRHPFIGKSLNRVKRSSLEIKFKEYLDSKNILSKENYKIAFYDDKVGYVKYKYYDFFIPSINCLVEIHGSYWHPKIEEEAISEIQKKNYLNDILKKKLAIDNMYYLLTLYDFDLDNFIKEDDIEKIINYLHSMPMTYSNFTTESIIPLPDYWTGLVDEESITVNLTPKNGKLHSVVGISSNTVEIECIGGEVDCYFMILGERKDVAKLVAEY